VVFSLDSHTKSVRKTSSDGHPASAKADEGLSLSKTRSSLGSVSSRKTKHQKGQKHRRNPVILAREWKEALDRGEYASQADLARKKGVSRARVTQILNLLKLDPEVQEMIARLGDPMLSGSVTERKLRGLLSLSARQQTKKLVMILSNR
jgi:hypothetical protein